MSTGPIRILSPADASASHGQPAQRYLDNEIVQQHLETYSFLRKALQNTTLVAGANQTIKTKKVLTREGTEEFRCVMLDQSGLPLIATPPNEYVTLIPHVTSKETHSRDLDGVRSELLRSENLTLLHLLHKCIEVTGNQTYAEVFTPSVFSTIRQSLQNKGIAACTSVIAADVFASLIEDQTFMTWFDPVTKKELVEAGCPGSLLNVTILTDYFWDQSTIPTGHVYMLGIPKSVGQFGSSKISINTFADTSRRFYSFQTCGIIDPAAVAIGVMTSRCDQSEVYSSDPSTRIQNWFKDNYDEFENWYRSQKTNDAERPINNESKLQLMQNCWAAAFGGSKFPVDWSQLTGKPIKGRELKEMLRLVWTIADVAKNSLRGIYQNASSTTPITVASNNPSEINEKVEAYLATRRPV